MISDSWPRRPSISRIYDDLLGGEDSYEEDRRFARRLPAMVPDARVAARANKSFLACAVRFLVKEAGIRQVIDIGTGLPAMCNTGQVARDRAGDPGRVRRQRPGWRRARNRLAGGVRRVSMGDRVVLLPAASVFGWERSYPGLPGQAGQVRAALRAFLDGCPAADDVIQLVSELAANAVLYSGSGKPGGQFTVRVHDHHGDHVYAEVEDQGSTWHADLARSARPPHGLYLLREISDACGTIRHPHARVVWFTIGYPKVPAPDHRDPIPLREAAP